MEAKIYKEGEKLLSSAFESGGLNADFVAEAYLQRARCRAHLGQFESAHQDLDHAGIGPQTAELYATRAFVFHKQGDPEKARAAEEKALKGDPMVTLFVD